MYQVGNAWELLLPYVPVQSTCLASPLRVCRLYSVYQVKCVKGGSFYVPYLSVQSTFLALPTLRSLTLCVWRLYCVWNAWEMLLMLDVPVQSTCLCTTLCVCNAWRRSEGITVVAGTTVVRVITWSVLSIIIHEKRAQIRTLPGMYCTAVTVRVNNILSVFVWALYRNRGNIIITWDSHSASSGALMLSIA